MKQNKGGKKLVLICLLLILVVVILYSGLRILESTVFSPDRQGQSETLPSKTVTQGEQDYFPRQDITVLMLLGIDQTGPMEDSGSYRNEGAADVVMLAVFDESAQTYDVLYLNRDTMLEMPVLGLGGKEAGSTYGQLALAHSYGSGLEDSCENVRNTVSTFLGGLYIDHYLSMNMDAIGILNDAVGGVTVNVTDDFSEVDATITQGTMTLNGEQAVHFLRSRKDVGNQLNLNRIERQKEYMTNFAAAVGEMAARDERALLDAYDRISTYSVSDCTAQSLSNLLDRFSSYKLERILTPEGENIRGEEYMEYYVDEEALDALILELFYAPKK